MVEKSFEYNIFPPFFIGKDFSHDKVFLMVLLFVGSGCDSGKDKKRMSRLLAHVVFALASLRLPRVDALRNVLHQVSACSTNALPSFLCGDSPGFSACSTARSEKLA
jgi:hypothetical protein